MDEKERFFSRAFPNGTSPNHEQHERGISKLGWFAAQFHAAAIARYGFSASLVVEESIIEAEKMINALVERNYNTKPSSEE